MASSRSRDLTPLNTRRYSPADYRDPGNCSREFSRGRDTRTTPDRRRSRERSPFMTRRYSPEPRRSPGHRSREVSRGRNRRASPSRLHGSTDRLRRYTPEPHKSPGYRGGENPTYHRSKDRLASISRSQSYRSAEVPDKSHNLLNSRTLPPDADEEAIKEAVLREHRKLGSMPPNIDKNEHPSRKDVSHERRGYVSYRHTLEGRLPSRHWPDVEERRSGRCRQRYSERSPSPLMKVDGNDIHRTFRKTDTDRNSIHVERGTTYSDSLIHDELYKSTLEKGRMISPVREMEKDRDKPYSPLPISDSRQDLEVDYKIDLSRPLRSMSRERTSMYSPPSSLVASSPAQGLFGSPFREDYRNPLRKKFHGVQQERQLAARYLDELLDFVSAEHPGPQGFLSLHLKCINALKDLNLPNLADFIFFHVAYRNLPKTNRKDFDATLGQTEFPTFSNIMDFAELAKQHAEVDLRIPQHHGPVQTRRSPITAFSIPQPTSSTTLECSPVLYKECSLCKSSNHTINNCPLTKSTIVQKNVVRKPSKEIQNNQKEEASAPLPNTLQSSSNGIAMGPCKCCKSPDHFFMHQCQLFRTMQAKHKISFLIANKLCLNCLGNHLTENCRSTGRCKHCNASHHTSLCGSLILQHESKKRL